jgi:hypothetical protein
VRVAGGGVSGEMKLAVRRLYGIWMLTAVGLTVGGAAKAALLAGATARSGTFCLSDGGFMSSSIVTEIPAKLYGSGSDVADTRDVSVEPTPLTKIVTNCPGATLIGYGAE